MKQKTLFFVFIAAFFAGSGASALPTAPYIPQNANRGANPITDRCVLEFKKNLRLVAFVSQLLAQPQIRLPFDFEANFYGELLSRMQNPQFQLANAEIRGLRNAWLREILKLKQSANGSEDFADSTGFLPQLDRLEFLFADKIRSLESRYYVSPYLSELQQSQALIHFALNMSFLLENRELKSLIEQMARTAAQAHVNEAFKHIYGSPVHDNSATRAKLLAVPMNFQNQSLFEMKFNIAQLFAVVK